MSTLRAATACFEITCAVAISAEATGADRLYEGCRSRPVPGRGERGAGEDVEDCGHGRLIGCRYEAVAGRQMLGTVAASEAQVDAADDLAVGVHDVMKIGRLMHGVRNRRQHVPLNLGV